MSHSGSRGPGATVAGHFTRRAREQHPKLPPELSHLAWLDLDSDDGREYWHAMNLMGEFASASHWVIHERVRSALGATVLAGVENHHNFAWLEEHDGRELVVHRKGATPAGAGVLGVIPGSMATPAFVVRGKGSAASLQSASHGAGRVMSRTAAKQAFTWKDVRPVLEAANVTLLAAGIDENPGVYKNIFEVMAQQADLVEIVARFDPRIVRMADGRERPED
jgi:tRNA-splicing ligase RtcB